MKLALLGALLAGLLLSAKAEPPTRAEVIEIARTYAALTWTPEARHVLHGDDADGIPVSTPDGPPASGKWVVGMENRGMPYKWGGFDSVAAFLKGLQDGKAAGDLYSSEKRRLGGSAVSRQAVGIDCSGFISRCWRLPTKHGTATLSRVARVLPSMSELQAGDCVNQAGGHVLLFVRWLDKTKSIAECYEAEPFSKVILSRHNLAELEASGFQPMRYGKIRD